MGGLDEALDRLAEADEAASAAAVTLAGGSASLLAARAAGGAAASVHPDFRLFLTSDMTQLLPASVVQRSSVTQHRTFRQDSAAV